MEVMKMKDQLQLGYNILEKIKLNGYGNEIIEDAQQQLLSEMYLKDGFKSIAICINKSIMQGRAN